MRNQLAKAHLDEGVLSHARRDFFRIGVEETVGEALARLRQRQCQSSGRIVYFYVLDDNSHLKGVIPTRRLLLSNSETKVSEVMESKVIALPARATLLDACEFFIFHRLLALPIVDERGRMLGVVDVDVYTDEISELAQWEEYDDIFQLIGVRLAQLEHASVPAAFQRRFP